MAKTNELSPVFIGIDLAWSNRNPSGCAVIRKERLVAHTADLVSKHDILHFVEEHLPEGAAAIIGIDAPLRVPNKSGSRPCDRSLSAEWRAFQAGALPANRRLLARGDPPTVRGEAIVELLVERLRFSETVPIPRRADDRIVCEIFPHPAHVSLFGLETSLKYKARRKRTYEERWNEFARYQQLLRGLRKAKPALKGTRKLLTKVDVRALRGKALKAYEDTLDAITCAYVANYLWHHGPRYTRVYGNVEEGHILVPLTKEMIKRL